MSGNVADLSIAEFKKIISDCVRETIEDAIEDLVALSSPTYIESIEEARRDIREGRAIAMEDLDFEDTEEK
jgi:hypothetical protein